MLCKGFPPDTEYYFVASNIFFSNFNATFYLSEQQLNMLRLKNVTSLLGVADYFSDSCVP